MKFLLFFSVDSKHLVYDNTRQLSKIPLEHIPYHGIKGSMVDELSDPSALGNVRHARWIDGVMIAMVAEGMMSYGLNTFYFTRLCCVDYCFSGFSCRRHGCVCLMLLHDFSN